MTISAQIRRDKEIEYIVSDSLHHLSDSELGEVHLGDYVVEFCRLHRADFASHGFLRFSGNSIRKILKSCLKEERKNRQE